MDTTQNFYKDMTIQRKEDIFTHLFSLGTNTSQKFSDKLELLHLICFFSFKMKERDREKFGKTINVLQTLYNKQFSLSSGEDIYLINLSIICDDLLFGVEDIQKPEGFSNMGQVCDRIKDLISQWMPF